MLRLSLVTSRRLVASVGALVFAGTAAFGPGAVHATLTPQVVSGDADHDLVRDNVDNCPTVYNPTQGDRDLDGIGDACDSTDGWSLSFAATCS